MASHRLHWPGVRFPPQDSLRSEFSCFSGTIRRCDSLPFSRRASFPSLGSTVPCTPWLCFSLGPACRPGPGVWVAGCPLSGFLGTEAVRVSHVPREPQLCLCPALRPRQRSPVPGHYGTGDVAPVQTTTRAPAFATFEAELQGVSTGCLRLAVRSCLRPTQDSLPGLARLAGWA